jgi:moderate conductance mechanosensitive channel
VNELLDALRDLGDDLPVKRLIAVALVFAIALIVSRLIRRVLRRAYWRRVEAVAELDHADQLHRAKRQQTVLTLLESATRYGIYGGAALFALGLVSTNASNAIFTAGVGVVLVGFALQRLLGDIIAGVLLLFEGRYAVGDFIQFHGQNAASGIVEEFGVRATTLRTLGGDAVTILNGSIVSFTRYNGGYREYRIECMAEGADVEEIVERLAGRPAGGDLFLSGPAVERIERAEGDELVTVSLRAIVAPSLAPLCEVVLPAQLEAALGERLRGPVLALEVDTKTWQTYSSSLLISR